MRQRYLIGLLAVCLACAIVEARGQSDTIANSTPQLQLTTEVVAARVCESGYLRLELRLRYLNIGNEPLILYRQSTAILTYFISKTIRNAALKKYEQKYSTSGGLIGPPEDLDAETPDEQKFVILNPGAHYEVTGQAHLPFIYDGKTKDSDLLSPGRHILEVGVLTWFAPQDLAVKLRERWRTQGFLWTQSVISQPMAFDVAEHPQVVDCSAAIRTPNYE